jgi:hypothetical protein
MIVEFFRWLGDIAKGKRTPHWLHLAAAPALAVAVGMYLYMQQQALARTHPVKAAVRPRS